MTSPSASSRPVAVVTGGASGIGLAMSEHLAGQAYTVVIMDLHDQPGITVAETVARQHPQGAVVFERCDVSSWDELAAAFRRTHELHGRVDVVMANAGISESGGSSLLAAADDGTGEPTRPQLRTLDVNLTGAIYTAKLAAHYMAKNEPDPDTGSRGCIVCTASNAGLYPFPVGPLYAASKGGVIALVRSLARPLERQGIQINALAPAVLETNIAPSKDLFKNMTVTPMATLVRGVAQILGDRSITGAVAEIHGDQVTLRPHLEYVDEDSRRNLENFWNLGYA